MTKLTALTATAACLSITLATGLALSSSARVGGARSPSAAGAVDPHAMMVRTPHDLPVIAHPIH